jgi:protein PsiE
MTIENRIDRFLSFMFRWVEKCVLVLVGGLALLAIGQLVLTIANDGEIRLEEVLLIFIFLEIMAMANVYFVRHAVPFTYPMFIAVTALSRLIVLQGKNIEPSTLLYESGAILLVSIAIIIIRYSQRYSLNSLDDCKHSDTKSDGLG